jgi:hypothetical protein
MVAMVVSLVATPGKTVALEKRVCLSSIGRGFENNHVRVVFPRSGIDKATIGTIATIRMCPKGGIIAMSRRLAAPRGARGDHRR